MQYITVILKKNLEKFVKKDAKIFLDKGYESFNLDA